MRRDDLNFALKMWSTDTHLIKESEHLVKEGLFKDVEVLVVPGSDITPWLSADFPIIIHCAHEKFGMNPGDPTKVKFNTQIVSEALAWRERFKTFMIIHPGHGSLDSAVKFMESIKTTALLVENMPYIGLNDEMMLGHDVQQMKLLVGKRRFFCMDISHAVKASISLNGYARHWILEDMASLTTHDGPSCIHVADGWMNNPKDEHLRIGEGNFDFLDMTHYGMFSRYSKVPLTLEVTRRGKTLEDDVQSRKKLIEMLSK